MNHDFQSRETRKRPAHMNARWETKRERRRREAREFMPWWVWAIGGAALAAMALSAMPMPV